MLTYTKMVNFDPPNFNHLYLQMSCDHLKKSEEVIAEISTFLIGGSMQPEVLLRILRRVVSLKIF